MQVSDSLNNAILGAEQQGLSHPETVARVFEVIEENARTGLASRADQERMLIQQLPALAAAGKDGIITALLDHDRGPAGTLRTKLGANASRIVETAVKNREAAEDEVSSGKWEEMQFSLGVKASRGQLSQKDIAGAKAFALDSRVAAGRKPLAGGEYFAGLIAQQDAFYERQRAEAERRAHEAAVLAAARAAEAKADQAIALGLGHELKGPEETAAIERAYERNRATAGMSHLKRRALDLKTFSETNTASPFSARLLSRGASALQSGLGISKDGKVGTQALLAMQEYGFYRKYAPRALSQIVPNAQDRALYDSYFTLTESGGWTSQQAMLRVQSIATGEFKPKGLTAAQRQDIRGAIKAKSARLGAVSTGLAWVTGAKDGSFVDHILFAGQENRSVVTSQVEQYAGELMKAGATAEGAVKTAMQRVSSQWTQFDGTLIFHNGTPIPQVFSKGIGRAVTKKLQSPELRKTGYGIGLFQSNVMVAPDGAHPGTWLLIDRDNLRVPLASITTQEVAAAAAEVANEPSILEKLGQIGHDITHPSNLVRLRKMPSATKK